MDEATDAALMKAGATIERLQRELGSAQWNEQQAWKSAAEMERQRNDARRERDEARATIERWRGLLNEAANALGRENEGLIGELCAAAGGDG